MGSVTRKDSWMLLITVAISSFALGHAVGASRRPIVNVPFQVDMHQPITKIEGKQMLPDVKWNGRYTSP